MQTKFYVPLSHSFREKCDDNLKLASHFSPILCDRGTWNFCCILTYIDTLCKPNFMFLGGSFGEKCDDNLKLKSHFSTILCDRGTWNFFCILIHMDTLCKPNFMFLGCSFGEKSDDNLKLESHFSPILCDRGTWNFFCILTHMDTLCKLNFMFLGRTVFEKNAMIHIEISIAFFSDTVRPRNLKFFLYINPYGYSTQTKFHVPRSHSFREKCDDNLKLTSHFSPILCDRGTWNFFCILTHMDTLCKPNFMFLGRTVFEKNAMITCKNSKLHNFRNKQLWNFTT